MVKMLEVARTLVRIMASHPLKVGSGWSLKTIGNLSSERALLPRDSGGWAETWLNRPKQKDQLQDGTKPRFPRLPCLVLSEASCNKNLHEYMMLRIGMQGYCKNYQFFRKKVPELLNGLERHPPFGRPEPQSSADAPR